MRAECGAYLFRVNHPPAPISFARGAQLGRAADGFLSLLGMRRLPGFGFLSPPLRNGDLSVLISAKARSGMVIAGVWSSREAPAGPESLRLRPGWGTHQRSGIFAVPPPPRPQCLEIKEGTCARYRESGDLLTLDLRRPGRGPPAGRTGLLSAWYVAGPS